MSRTKEFDPDVAVGVAMELFWEQGYEATSISDLLGALGIGRQSFYDTFGSKHDLYLRALDAYVAGAPGPTPVELLSRPGPAIDAVRALVESYAAPQKSDRPRGCLVVNACVECPPGDDAVARLLSSNLHGNEIALAATLRRAQAEGDLSSGADPAALARFLLTVMNGLQVLRRAGEKPDVLSDAARVALDALA